MSPPAANINKQPQPVALKPFQLKPTERLVKCLLAGNSKGQLIIGPTGSGKTFVMAFALKQCQQEHGKYLTDIENLFKLHNIFVLVPKNSIVQTQRVFSKVGVKSCYITNADSLRTQKGGELYVDWVSEYRQGILTQKPVWKKDTMPDVILADECQFFKNPKSQRTKILISYVEQGGKLILISATPFQKACEAELTITACGFLGEHNSYAWYADQVSNYNPTGNSPIAIKRIKEDIEKNGCLNSITGVKYPFKPTISNWMIDANEEGQAAIARAYDEYAEKRRKILNKPDHQGIIELWQAQRVMREKCELLRVPHIINESYRQESSADQPKAILLASNFIPTLRAYWSYLTRQCGVPADKISFLIGGLSDSKRQTNIDNFQLGKTNYFLTTMKSGGVSLSLNHQYPSARPRLVLLPPTWSIYELLQMLGRAQRIDNLSAVTQRMTWFKGTIEEEVADRLDEKYKCIAELIDRKDDYIGNLFNKAIDKGFEPLNPELEEQLAKLEEKQQIVEAGEDEDELAETNEEDTKENLKSLFESIEL